jgi:small subunit ribosomal protein S20
MGGPGFGLLLCVSRGASYPRRRKTHNLPSLKALEAFTAFDKRDEKPHIMRPLGYWLRIASARNEYCINCYGVKILANSAQARKRARQAETHRQRNAGQRAAFRTAVKKVVSAIEAGNKEEATELYKSAVPVIDSIAGKGLISANKGARHKSRLNARIKAL